MCGWGGKKSVCVVCIFFFFCLHGRPSEGDPSQNQIFSEHNQLRGALGVHQRLDSVVICAARSVYSRCINSGGSHLTRPWGKYKSACDRLCACWHVVFSALPNVQISCCLLVPSCIFCVNKHPWSHYMSVCWGRYVCAKKKQELYGDIYLYHCEGERVNSPVQRKLWLKEENRAPRKCGFTLGKKPFRVMHLKDLEVESNRDQFHLHS